MFPWYYHCKLGFLVWLQSQKGAEKLYRDYLRPLLLKNEKSVDAALNFLEKEVGTQVRAAETDIGKFAHYARDVKDAFYVGYAVLNRKTKISFYPEFPHTLVNLA